MSDVATRTAEIMRRLVSARPDADGRSTDEEMMNLRLADLEFDSLEKMGLIMELEDAFDVSLDEEDILACERVADLVRLIEQSA